MIERLRHYGDILRASLWLVPALMGMTAVAIAIGLLTLGTGIPDSMAAYWLLYSGKPEVARELLSALLSGMITMTSLVVSITMVVLTLAAGQIGPRLIQNFIRDRVTQVVLGLFLSDILYLLVVLRNIDGSDDGGVPHLAVSAGTMLTVLCLFTLLFYVHKLARSIIYDTVVSSVASDLRRTVQRLLPEKDAVPPRPAPCDEAAWIELGRDGYVQTVDLDALVETARRADAVVRLEVRPGHFVIAAGRHVAVHPAEACSADVRERVCAAFIIGSERTPSQDLEYGIHQLVEIATRALSPGLNDIFTALAVIDNLSASLGHIFGRGLEPSVLCDQDGAVRVVRTVADRRGIIGAAFDQIRQAGAAHPAVLIRLLDAIGRVAPCATSADIREPLLAQMDMIREAGRNSAVGRDADAIEQRWRQARAGLVDGAGPEPSPRRQRTD